MNGVYRIAFGLCLVQAMNLLYTASSPVVQLNQGNFSNLVTKSEDLWMVEFYAPWCGHCKSLAPEFEKAAKVLKGIVKIGAVDMTTDQGVGSPYDIKGFPTLKFFGINKGAPLDYNGARTAQGIVDFVLSQIKSITQSRMSGGSGSSGSSSNNQSGQAGGYKAQDSGKGTVELTESTFKETVLNQSKNVWMVIFYAPWCGHCKSAMPDWDSAAKEADEGIKFGKVDCTAHQSICSNYGVQGYPTIKAFINGKAEDYSGARDKESFLTYATTHKDAMKPPRELAQLTSQQIFDDYCIESKSVCIISFIPIVEDSGIEKRKEYIEHMNSLRNKHQSKPLTFIWAQGGDNFDFEEAMGLGFGFPSVIAVNYGKKKYSIMRAQYSKENVDKFIGELLTGRSPVYNLRDNLPKIKPKPASKAQTEEL